MTERDEPEQPKEPSGFTRRDFMNKTAAAGAGLVIVPRHVLGRGMQAPSDTVNIATVGVSGMGSSNTNAVLSQNIVAFCDVDDRLLGERIELWKNPPPPRAAGAQAAQNRQNRRKPHEPTPAQVAANEKRPRQSGADNMKRFVEVQLPKIQRYRDYREMLDKQKDIDGIIVATPDHMHAAIAVAAMDLGKHVYVQKPLCWSVEEARLLAKKAKDHPKVVTQMGNQGHSRDEARLGYEYINSGAIGEIREVHVWTNRPYGFWPQGVPRPAPLPARLQDQETAAKRWRGGDVDAKIAAMFQGNGYTPADQLAWELFLGVAPKVDYHPIYHPFNWRGWVDWGQGALGDMGAHLLDHPFWSLKLGLPTVIETRSTPFNGASFPTATTTYYEFPSRGNLPAVKLTWYDGGLTPPKPPEIGDENLNGEGGIIYIGSKGKMMQETYGLNPRILPDSKHASTPRPKQVLPRIPHEAHEMNWVDAIRGQQEASSPIEYAAALTEVMLLGIVSLRAGGKIHYDGANRRVTNKVVNENSRDGDIDPNQFLSREYRQGWTL